ncbi:MAG: TIR domain-containing protein [Clostridiales bacterium]|nr:TIR domain-containing protein [Clostridiales bacterium]
MAHEVFISYSQEDSKAALALCHKLEEDKIKCWITPRDVSSSTNHATEISKAILKSDIFVLLLSASSNIAKPVIREVEIALNNNLSILPIRIEDIVPTGSMYFFLSTTHWIDAIDDDIESNIEGLAYKIKSRINNEVKSRKKRKSKKILIGTSVFLAIAVLCISIFIFKDKILDTFGFGKEVEKEVAIEESPIKVVATPIPIKAPEDYNLDPEMLVDIPDATFKNAIIHTLNDMGESVEGELSVGDMFKLDTLMISQYDAQYPRASGGYRNVSAYSTTDSMLSIEGLQFAHNLTCLIISNKKISDLSPVSGLERLEIISISETIVENIDALANLKSLYYVAISDDPRDEYVITDISALSGLSKLKYLVLNNTENINDLSPLAELNNLISFHMSNPDLSDFSPIGKITSLQKLYIDMSDFNDMSVLVDLKELQELYLPENNISDVSPLAELPNLGIINLSNNQIIYVGSLQYLEDLSILDIHDNDIRDIRQLENLNNLIELTLDGKTYNSNLETIGILKEKNVNVVVID